MNRNKKVLQVVIDEPNEKQRKFMQTKRKHIGYGGARGGGKSWAVRSKSVLLGGNYPKIRMCIVRRTYPELEENHIGFFRDQFLPLGRYNESKHKFRFKNGSTITFRYCKSDKDLETFQGSEFDVIFIDEATQFTEHQLKYIASCCRGANDFPHRVYYTCNPGGVGHGYIKRIFVDKKYLPNENPDDYEFIQALVYDNKVLMEKDPTYVAILKNLPPKLRKAHLDGDWNIFEGQFFEDFMDRPEHYEDRLWTHVIEPFEPPKEWQIYRSYDFGYAKPFSVGWWAVDYDGRLYRILEWYGCTSEPNEGLKLTPEQQFAHIREIEDTHPWLKGKRIYGVADPAIWDSSRGESINEIAEKYRVYFEPGDNKRIPGWMQVHYRFQFDDNGIPMMYIFNNCKAFIRTFPLQIYDEKDVEDLDTNMEDHCPDEVRYMCMSRPIAPKATKPVIPVGDDPLNQRVKKRRYL